MAETAAVTAPTPAAAAPMAAAPMPAATPAPMPGREVSGTGGGPGGGGGGGGGGVSCSVRSSFRRVISETWGQLNDSQCNSRDRRPQEEEAGEGVEAAKRPGGATRPEAAAGGRCSTAGEEALPSRRRPPPRRPSRPGAGAPGAMPRGWGALPEGREAARAAREVGKARGVPQGEEGARPRASQTSGGASRPSRSWRGRARLRYQSCRGALGPWQSHPRWQRRCAPPPPRAGASPRPGAATT